MKIEKNKIVFGSVLALVIIFIVAYTALVFGDNEEEPAGVEQTLLPKLEEEQEEFESRLDAVNALKEEREKNPPSIYNDKFLDSLGYFDPDLSEKQKLKIVDSIYDSGRINYSENNYRNFPKDDFVDSEEIEKEEKSSPEVFEKEPLMAKELALEHQLFFSINHLEGNEKINSSKKTTAAILVEVDGEQVVKAGHRLRMRFLEDAVINGNSYSKSTPIFGFVSFQPNRALIEIENINHLPVDLKAYDFQDGSEGIYVENSFRADLRKEVVDDIIQDIDIPGVPQVGGFKKVFQRNNRNIKVTVTNNYKLLLKSF